MRVAIVEDTLSERLNLRALLERQASVEIVGEAETLAAARTLLATTQPDVVFLDVELGRENGFQLLESPQPLPRIVFTTLHLHYAAQAFDREAFDYLVKPIAEKRLLRTLRRLEQAVASPAPAAPPKLDADDLLIFRQGEVRHILPVARIAVITGDGDYTRIVAVDGREYLDSRRIRDWHATLPSEFQLLDRSTIFNLAEVSAYRPSPEGGVVILRNAPAPWPIGPTAFKRLEETLLRR